MVTATDKGTALLALVVLLGLTAALLLPTTASAGKPEVTWVELNREARHWRITVTLSHSDTDDYHFLDRWHVHSPDHQVFGEERFHTPRVQAPERISTLRDVRIPRDVDTLLIRARDSLHGWGPRVEVDLTEERGERYRIRTDTDW
ncbi:MAG: hypothetical protein ACQERR_06880 [Pseudomonadota bacterium]